ncbi:hypothetical protein [Streptomyces sp. bgisy084]
MPEQRRELPHREIRAIADGHQQDPIRRNSRITAFGNTLFELVHGWW